MQPETSKKGTDNKTTAAVAKKVGTTTAKGATATTNKVTTKKEVATETVVAKPKAATKTTKAKTTPATKKTPAVKKVATKKTPATKKSTTSLSTELFIQFAGYEVSQEELVARVKEDWVGRGNKVSDMNAMSLYVKPEEYKAYYVINGSFAGEITL